MVDILKIFSLVAMKWYAGILDGHWDLCLIQFYIFRTYIPKARRKRRVKAGESEIAQNSIFKNRLGTRSQIRSVSFTNLI